MGQKVSPIGLRLGINKNWESRWFPKFGTIPANVAESNRIRKYVKKELYYAKITQTTVERTAKKVGVTAVAARPSIIIGKKGADVERLKDAPSRLVGKEIAVNIKKERKLQISTQLSTGNVAQQLERRVAFRGAMKRVMQGALRGGAKGIKISVSGGLGGAEMVRTEWHLGGRAPLHTLRTRIDYGFTKAHTTYGCTGIKVWAFKDEVLAKDILTEKAEEATSKPKRKPAKKRSK